MYVFEAQKNHLSMNPADLDLHCFRKKKTTVHSAFIRSNMVYVPKLEAY